MSVEYLEQLLNHPEPALILEVSAAFVGLVALVLIFWLRSRRS